MEDERVVGGIPFFDDLLFNFFNKDTIITDTYIYDAISTLKLYPKKSNNLVTTSVNTQFHVDKSLVNHNLGFEIYYDIYYNPATLSTSNYNALCGRGNNTSLHSGLFLPGANASNYFYGCWRNISANSYIIKTGLTADFYRYSMVVTATTVQVKLLNLRTNVLINGNVAAVGTIDTADNINFTFLCYGINGATGAYGSVGVNVSNIRISRGSTCLLNVPLCEGAGDKVTDICNSSQYQITFFTVASGWAKLADYSFHNFRYGFTLYQKSGENNLYIPNTTAQNEIILAAVPSGYSRVANHKECRTAFNQCENVFKLDNVAEVSRDVLAVCPDTFYSGLYVRQNDELYICAANNCEISLSGGTWRFRNRTTYAIPYIITRTNVVNPGIEDWSPVGVTCSNPVVFSNLDLYNADVDHYLFTINTGVAKEIDLRILNMASISDRGYLYYNETLRNNFMLYATDKNLLNDVKIIKYIGMSSRITYDESGAIEYDENDHVNLTEV